MKCKAQRGGFNLGDLQLRRSPELVRKLKGATTCWKESVLQETSTTVLNRNAEDDCQHRLPVFLFLTELLRF